MLEKIVSKTIFEKHDNWAMNINQWDWVPGVGMYGISRVFKTTNDEKVGQFIKNWIDTHMHKAYEVRVVNSFAPLLTVLEWYQYSKEEKYLNLCIDIADWMITKAPITCDAAFEHTVTEGAVFKEQLWADTLFMACLFLGKLGKEIGQSKYTDFASNQLKIHYEFLQDKERGLFFHGWDGAGRTHMSSAYWARANAWVTASTVELLEVLGDFEGREDIIVSLQKQVEAISKCQKENGMFSTVLDKDFYDESSATAGFAYGIKRGIKDGCISEKYMSVYEKAKEAVLSRVSDDGAVTQVSGGTPVMPTIEDYNAIEICSTLYGQALTLLMLCE